MPTFTILAGNSAPSRAFKSLLTYIILFLFIFYMTEFFTQDEVNNATKKANVVLLQTRSSRKRWALGLKVGKDSEVFLRLKIIIKIEIPQFSE